MEKWCVFANYDGNDELLDCSTYRGIMGSRTRMGIDVAITMPSTKYRNLATMRNEATVWKYQLYLFCSWVVGTCAFCISFGTLERTPIRLHITAWKVANRGRSMHWATVATIHWFWDFVRPSVVTLSVQLDGTDDTCLCAAWAFLSVSVDSMTWEANWELDFPFRLALLYSFSVYRFSLSFRSATAISDVARACRSKKRI